MEFTCATFHHHIAGDRQFLDYDLPGLTGGRCADEASESPDVPGVAKIWESSDDFGLECSRAQRRIKAWSSGPKTSIFTLNGSPSPCCKKTFGSMTRAMEASTVRPSPSLKVCEVDGADSAAKRDEAKPKLKTKAKADRRNIAPSAYKICATSLRLVLTKNGAFIGEGVRMVLHAQKVVNTSSR